MCSYFLETITVFFQITTGHKSKRKDKDSKSNTWKTVGYSMCGAIGLLLSVCGVVALCKRKRKGNKVVGDLCKGDDTITIPPKEKFERRDKFENNNYNTEENDS